MMGMGEPLYNLDAVRDALLIVADGEGIAFPSAASRCRPPAWCRISNAPAPRSAACWRCRCMRCATSCATNWCRSTANIRSRNCWRPAAIIPAPPTPSASRSNTSCSRASTIPSRMPKRWCGCSRASRPRSISFRSIPGPARKYECSDWEQIEKFSAVVFDAGYASPVRTPRGRDILAACGQLKSATEKIVRARAHGVARHGDDGLTRGVHRPHHRHLVRRHGWRAWQPASPSPWRCWGRNGMASPAIPVEHVCILGHGVHRSRRHGCRRLSADADRRSSGRGFKIRSLLIHAAAGAAMMLLGYYGAGFASRYEESIDHPPPPISREAEIAAAAGVVFGLTYWADCGPQGRPLARTARRRDKHESHRTVRRARHRRRGRRDIRAFSATRIARLRASSTRSSTSITMCFACGSIRR